MVVNSSNCLHFHQVEIVDMSVISHIRQLKAKTCGVMSEFEVCSKQTWPLKLKKSGCMELLNMGSDVEPLFQA